MTARCENYVFHVSGYFLSGERQSIRCGCDATHVVMANPYQGPEKDGTVQICETCERWDYQTFPRWRIPTTASHGGEHD